MKRQSRVTLGGERTIHTRTEPALSEPGPSRTMNSSQTDTELDRRISSTF